MAPAPAPWGLPLCRCAPSQGRPGNLPQAVLREVLGRVREGRGEGNAAILALVEELATTLHTNHYLIIGLKEIVIQVAQGFTSNPFHF